MPCTHIWCDGVLQFARWHQLEAADPNPMRARRSDMRCRKICTQRPQQMCVPTHKCASPRMCAPPDMCPVKQARPIRSVRPQARICRGWPPWPGTGTTQGASKSQNYEGTKESKVGVKSMEHQGFRSKETKEPTLWGPKESELGDIEEYNCGTPRTHNWETLRGGIVGRQGLKIGRH